MAPTMEKQMDKKMENELENEMEAGLRKGFVGVVVNDDEYHEVVLRYHISKLDKGAETMT